MTLDIMKEILNISVIMQHKYKDILEDIITENII